MISEKQDIERIDQNLDESQCPQEQDKAKHQGDVDPSDMHLKPIQFLDKNGNEVLPAKPEQV